MFVSVRFPANIYIYINDVALVFLFLTLNIFHTFFSVSIVDFKQVNIIWLVFIFLQFQNFR